MSTQPRDCIYCGQHANSREHVWLAGLGGRRTNKGILCSACNAHFAELDALLISQLALIRGLIGVRPDHDSVAAPGRVPTKEGVLMLDSAGRPSWLIPRLRRETPLHDRISFAIVECEGEAQIQQWRQTMRERGIDARPIDRDAGARFIEQPVQLRWSFGGDEAFREIARLVLNVIADLYPRVARLPGLQPIKQWIWGERATELPVVWFNDGSVALSPPVFAFGHRVALRFDEETGEVFAVVSFFNAFEYIVALGAIGVDICVRVIVEVDPLVERPPGDRAIVEGEVGLLMGITQPSSITVTDAQRSHLSACTRELGERIVERQAQVLFSGVLPQINAVRELPAGERGEAIREALAVPSQKRRRFPTKISYMNKQGTVCAECSARNLKGRRLACATGVHRRRLSRLPSCRNAKRISVGESAENRPAMRRAR